MCYVQRHFMSLMLWKASTKMQFADNSKEWHFFCKRICWYLAEGTIIVLSYSNNNYISWEILRFTVPVLYTLINKLNERNISWPSVTRCKIQWKHFFLKSYLKREIYSITWFNLRQKYTTQFNCIDGLHTTCVQRFSKTFE